jgi:hypothetical protein
VGVKLLPQRQVLQDWTRVEDLEVDSSQKRSFEYHVVEDVVAERIMLTIKCLDGRSRTVRLDPTVLATDADPSSFIEIAERRVRQLYDKGMI